MGQLLKILVPCVFAICAVELVSLLAIDATSKPTSKVNRATLSHTSSPPQYDTISTGTISLVLGIDGRFGAGGNGGNKGVQMDYFYFPAECDTVDSIPGHTEHYLFDGSVFIGRIVCGDTIVSNMIFENGPNPPTSLIPLSVHTGPTTDGVVQFWNSGIISTADSSIGMRMTYYAPQNTVNYDFGGGKIWKTDEQFITRELKVWSLDELPHENITVGEVIDWDAPSDSAYDNFGEVDVPSNLLYCFGAEYDQDNSLECQDNNLRYAGMAFAYFKRYVSHPDTLAWFIVDTIPFGGYHESNSRYIYHGWEDNELYSNVAANSDLNPWLHTNPDSLATDLHSVLTYVFEYDLIPGDTLVFYSVLATVRNEDAETLESSTLRIKELSDKGRNFTRYFGCCHNLRGDLNTDGIDGNLVDLAFLVSRVFRNGPLPTCGGEGDVNADGTPSNIVDLSYLVDKIFRGGPLPYSCGEPPCNTSGCHSE